MATIDIAFQLDTGSLPAPEVLRLVSTYLGYPETVGGEPNPQTRAQFARAKIAQQIAEWARAQRQYEAREAAAAALVDEITGS